MARPIRIALALALASAGVTTAEAKSAQGPEWRISRQIASLLDRHSLVGLGETHRSAAMHAVYRRIIVDPQVFCRVDDIVVEFGNARLQPVADRFVSGGKVTIAEKRSMWRETGQWLVWDSPVYERFFDLIRETNARKMCGNHQVRVLLGDPPIDWAKVTRAEDYKAFADRAATFVGVIEREVLAKNRKALLIIGSTHLMKSQPAEFKGSMTEAQILQQRYPGKLCSLIPVTSDIARRLRLAPAPSLTLVSGTRLGSKSYAALAPSGTAMLVKVDGKDVWTPANQLSWPRIDKVVDGLLSLGDAGPELLPDPAVYHDRAYQKELRRRAVILKDVYGIDFIAELEEQLSRH